MEDARGIDPFIIQQLQEAAMAGKSATQLLALWQSSLVAAGKSGSNRVDKTIYFGEAFGWGIGQMTALGTWSHFGAGGWSDEMIDARYAPLLEEWRKNPPPPRASEEDEDAALSLSVGPISDAEAEEAMKSLEMDWD